MDLPFPRTDLPCDLCDGRSECGEAVQDGDASRELRDLTVDVACIDALTEPLDAVHLGFGPASAVVSAPSLPDRSTDALWCAQEVAPGDCPGGVGFPRFGVLEGRDNCDGATGGDGILALAGVKCAVGCDAGDLLLGWDLVKKLRQHRGVAHVAGGELGRPDFEGFLVDANMDLAPNPD